MVYSHEEIQEFKETLIDCYGFKSDAEIFDVAYTRTGYTGTQGIAVLLKTLNDETFVKGALVRDEYYRSHSREKDIDSAIMAVVVNV